MANRAGVGATLASAVIFSVLLASNLSVYCAAQENSRLHLVSNAEDAIADDGVASEGAAGTNILLREQALFESNVFECESATAAVSWEISKLTDVQESASLTVVTAASPVSWGPASDNLSMLAPFGGYIKGLVNTGLHEVMKAAEAPLGVSYERNETHYVHLPVRLEDMASDCDRTLSAVEGAVSITTPPECTPSVVYPIIAEAAGALSSRATGSGFRLSVHPAIVDTAPCTADVVVEVSQTNVVGPAGNFSVELLEEGAAVFEH